MAASDLNVSLEPHLRDSLSTLQSLIPDPLRSQLSGCLPSNHVTIPYELLRSISQWSRTPEALEQLRSEGLDPNSYTMVALLAGTKTSPERNFGHYERPPEPEDVVARDQSERKAIATLVNAVLSVGGSGAAAWWGSVHTGWTIEWVRVNNECPMTMGLMHYNSACNVLPHRGIGGGIF